MNAAIPKTLSVVLAIAALIFGGLGLTFSTWAVHSYATWPTVDAVVDSIEAQPIVDNKYGAISLRFRYAFGFGQRFSWASRTEFGSRGEKFMREYAIGTRHKIWLDPTNREHANVGLGLNLATMFVPLLLFGICSVLLLAARYYWRFQ